MILNVSRTDRRFISQKKFKSESKYLTKVRVIINFLRKNKNKKEATDQTADHILTAPFVFYEEK